MGLLKLFSAVQRCWGVGEQQFVSVFLSSTHSKEQSCLLLLLCAGKHLGTKRLGSGLNSRCKHALHNTLVNGREITLTMLAAHYNTH